MHDIADLVALFRERASTLVLYARQWLPRERAEDVVQDVFAKLIERRQRVPGIAWLYRCVRNAAISELRSTRSRLQREQRIAGERSDWFDASPDALIDAARAAELIEQLPAAQREALVLRIWSGLGFAEIADVMNISTSTAFAHCQSALAELKKRLEKPCPTKT